MNRRSVIPALSVALATLGTACAQVEGVDPLPIAQCTTYTDPAGDAAWRHPYSFSPDGQPVAYPLPGTLPDIVSLSICGWNVTNEMNRYEGQMVAGANADFFRLDLVLNGLFNPPNAPNFVLGTTDSFGPQPVFGFVELNLDRNIDTGGQISSEAKSHYLANIARFAARPRGALAQRAVLFGHEVDADCTTEPGIEQTGAEFMLNFCGCDPITVVPQEATSNADTVFDAGETWDLEGRFFRIATGYDSTGPFFGGSASGAYDPVVPLRFSHSTETDQTTITLVFPITLEGAALISPNDFVDTNFDAADDSFIEEALEGIIFSADANAPINTGCSFFEGWRGGSVSAEMLNPTRWLATAIVGIGGLDEAGCPFQWTDVGFGHLVGDLDADGVRTYADRSLLLQTITQYDGGPIDTDGTVNGQVTLGGSNYSVFDINGNGVISDTDQRLFVSACAADLNGDRDADVIDLLIFLADWFDMNADFNLDGDTNVLDLLDYIDRWFQGCD